MSKKLPGKFVWFELVNADNKQAQAFYGEVLGWKVTPFEMGDQTYDMIKPPEGESFGGYSPEKVPGAPPHWIAHLSVPSVDAGLETVEKRGGKVLAPAFDVPTIGRMALVADPTGAPFFLFQGEGDDAADAPSKPGSVHWNELITTDADKAVAFYTELAGYTDKPMDMGPIGTYHVLEQGGTPRAGIIQMKDVPQSAWLPYFDTAKVDETTARAKKLGATVMTEPSDIPGIGRFAVLTDPQGAAFALITPAR